MASAIGAFIAGQKRVYAIVGDGAFTAGIESLIEAVRKKADIRIVIIDNGGISEKEPLNLDIKNIATIKGVNFIKRIDSQSLNENVFVQMESSKGPSILIINYNQKP